MQVNSENNSADIGTKTQSSDKIIHLLRLLGTDEARARWTTVDSNEEDAMKGPGRSGATPKPRHSATDARTRKTGENRPSGTEVSKFDLRDRLLVDRIVVAPL